jgi:pimeloyl-ACP methyl ester carboxylesterase
MKTIPFLVLAAAIAVCLVLTAGCTGSSGTTCPSPSLSAPAQQLQPVSINATPVKYAEVNGVRLAYREFGKGEPLLMLEGFGATMDTAWNETFLTILASKYHVYIYDHRGVGYSSDNNAPPTIQQYSEDAAALMPALGYESMNVYGVSMGSTISQQLVIDHPERVRKLVLDSATYSIRIPETAVLFNTIQLVENGTTPEPAGVVKEAQANLAWNGSWNGLAGIHKDVMLVVGTADVLTPQPVAVRMAGQINGSWLVRFKDIPHVGSKYAPVEYGKNALDFFDMNETPPYQFP